MEKLEVRQVNLANQNLDEVFHKIDQIPEKNSINKISWENFNYKPEVYFKIAHSNNLIYLKYYIEENEFLATKLSINENVFEDSCVEFFLSLDGAKTYYNLEFNFHGTCQMGHCTKKDDMKLLPLENIKKIKTKSIMHHKFTENGDSIFAWELLILIPIDVFVYNKTSSLKGKILKANFYKCGDKLKKAHYLSWNKIKTKTPDFHQPKYFGELKFV